ncbi:MAG: hypothetical protein USCAAHI_00847 [Beijerinckiaceae bacterium]|nr:MAG: hypothetical protein USCAAHI_00847 [Beijerinckiaceae bacterium]
MQMKAINVARPGLVIGIALQRFDLPILDKKDKSCAVLKIIYIRSYATNLKRCFIRKFRNIVWY